MSSDHKKVRGDKTQLFTACFIRIHFLDCGITVIYLVVTFPRLRENSWNLMDWVFERYSYSECLSHFSSNDTYKVNSSVASERTLLEEITCVLFQ